MVPFLGGVLMFLLTLLLQFIKLKSPRKHHHKLSKRRLVAKNRAILSTISGASTESESASSTTGNNQESPFKELVYHKNASDDSFSVESSSNHSDETEAAIDPEGEGSYTDSDEIYYYTWTRNATMNDSCAPPRFLSDSMYAGALVVCAVAVTSLIAATTRKKH